MLLILIAGFNFRLEADNRVSWSDGWEHIRRLEEEGYFRHRSAGPSCYGHTDFFWTGKLH
jgi:hypothetical protein